MESNHPLKNFKRKEFTIESRDLCEIINKYRIEEGKSPKEHKTFMRNIRDEIKLLENAGIEIPENKFVPGSYIDKQNQERPCYILNKESAIQILNRESAYVRYKTAEYITYLEDELNRVTLELERNLSSVTHAMLHEIIGDYRKSISLDMLIYQIASYKLNLSQIYKKDTLYRLDKSNLIIYDEILKRAYDTLITCKTIDDNHFMANTRKVLKKFYIEDEYDFKEYVKNTPVIDTIIPKRGFGKVFRG